MELREGNVVWVFGDEGVNASKYDEWQFYRKHFVSCVDDQNSDHKATKAVDIVAFYGAANTLWLIEAKDFTLNRRDSNKEPLWVEIARKVRDTLAGLMAAARLAYHEDERELARVACAADCLRIVLHIEQPTNPSKLFPQSYELANLKQKLKSQIRCSLDPHPIVMDCRAKRDNPSIVPWDVRWEPAQQAPQA